MLRYAGYLASLGHEVTIISPRTEVECNIPAGVKLQLFKPMPGRCVGRSCQLVYLPRVARCLRAGFDVVIPVHTPLAVHAVFAKRLYRLNFRLVLLYQDFFKMPWVGRYIRWVIARKWLANALDETIAVSEGSAREFRSASKVLPKVIPNGIEDVFFVARRPAKGRYVLFVGRPLEGKGFFVFAKAMRRVVEEVADMKGILVSTGVDDGMLGAIQTVRFRSKEQLRDLYAEALVYAHAAVGESFGLPPLEAMAAGTATVLTKTVGTDDYARDQHNCLASSFGDSEALARNIIRLIQDDNLRHRLEENGRETAARFKWEHSLKQFEAEITRANT